MTREQARARAEALVDRMTVEEAASQLCYDAPAIERLGVPAYNWWNEALHGVARAGVATSFPQAIGIAATFDPALVRALGDIAATEGRAKYNAAAAHGDRDIYKGLTFWSPNVNIFRDPRWGRGHETYGEDPTLTAELGVEYVKGLQGEGDVMKSAACAKHFAVHSGPESLRHEFDAVAGPKDLNETYLPAFERLVKEAKVEAVMGAYNRTNGEVCCGSKTLIKDTLRGKWGFEGHYVSDCWAIADFHMFHHVTDTPEESAALALENGCDVNCGVTYQYMLKAYEQGKVTEDQIRLAAERLFTTRYMLGIMEGSEFDSIAFDKVECAEHLKKAHEAAIKSCVLLKNDGLLPLNKDALKTIGVVGPNANSRVALMGNYHGTSSRYITILEGIQDAMGDDVRVLASEGSHLFRDKVENLGMDDDRISEAVIVAENSDAVVLCVGLDETLEGEQGDTGNSDASGDKKDLLLPAAQRPEHTEGYEGFIMLMAMQGEVEESSLVYIIRDHDMEKFQQKKAAMEAAAAFINAKYGEGTLELHIRDSYFNMRKCIEPHFYVVERAMKAMEAVGMTPKAVPIRGGTDGARLSYEGLPCPNLCTGGENYHGRFEYIPVEDMETCVDMLVALMTGL